MKSKFGREILWLCLPVLILGGAALWKSRGSKRAPRKPALKIERIFVSRYGGETQIQFSSQRTGRMWTSDGTTPRIEKVWATDVDGKVLRTPLNLKPALQCQADMGSNGRWYFIYHLKFNASARHPKKIVIHHVVRSDDSAPTPVKVVLKTKEHY